MYSMKLIYIRDWDSSAVHITIYEIVENYINGDKCQNNIIIPTFQMKTGKGKEKWLLVDRDGEMAQQLRVYILFLQMTWV